ncbi:MAG: transcription elongation factor GreA [Lachnospiraceae bacterium]|nr:transcription elongation factor GreA [Lachnospiraceae bacterium]
MEEAKKNLLTREGLKKYEDELHDLKINRRKEVSEKLKEARAQGDLSENAEYDAAKDEQRDIEARIFELEQLLKNVEVVDEDEDTDNKKIAFGMQVVILDKETKEEFTYVIKGASEADSLNGSISNESPLGKALIGAKKGQTIEVECPVGTLKYKVVSFTRDFK